MAIPIAPGEIKRFVAEWYRALDCHASVEDCAQFLADAELEMIIPEKTLHGLSDFRVWYAGGEYSDGMKTPGVINIFFDETHVVQSIEVSISGEEVDVDVFVGWQASWWEPPAAKSKRTSLDATQHWKVRRSSKNNYGLEIISYNAIVEPFKYAPGFARLEPQVIGV
jgi:hypothetical protein